MLLKCAKSIQVAIGWRLLSKRPRSNYQLACASDGENRTSTSTKQAQSRAPPMARASRCADPPGRPRCCCRRAAAARESEAAQTRRVGAWGMYAVRAMASGWPSAMAPTDQTSTGWWLRPMHVRVTYGTRQAIDATANCQRRGASACFAVAARRPLGICGPRSLAASPPSSPTPP